MTVTINLSPEVEATLRERAAASGKDVEALVREAVEEKLGLAGNRPGLKPPEELSYAEWKERFDAWMREVEARADRYPPGFVVDDSRESIYEGRGE